MAAEKRREKSMPEKIQGIADHIGRTGKQMSHNIGNGLDQMGNSVRQGIEYTGRETKKGFQNLGKGMNEMTTTISKNVAGGGKVVGERSKVILTSAGRVVIENKEVIATIAGAFAVEALIGKIGNKNLRKTVRITMEGFIMMLITNMEDGIVNSPVNCGTYNDLIREGKWVEVTKLVSSGIERQTKVRVGINLDEKQTNKELLDLAEKKGIYRKEEIGKIRKFWRERNRLIHGDALKPADQSIIRWASEFLCSLEREEIDIELPEDNK